MLSLGEKRPSFNHKRSFDMAPLSKSQIILEEYKSEDEQSLNNNRTVEYK